MAIKAILDSIDDLPDPLKAEYKQGDDGKFHLDVEDIDNHPSVGALKRAKDYEKAERQKAAKSAQELKEQLEALAEERENLLKGAIPKGDVDKLEASYKEKLSKREKELSDQIAGLNSNLKTLLVDNVAQSLAAKISDSPDLLLPHIRGRLQAELVDGKAVTRVLDAEGNPSALTVDELQKELVANPVFAPIIRASKATGGGAKGGNESGNNGQKSISRAEFDKLSPEDKRAFIVEQKGTVTD